MQQNYGVYIPCKLEEAYCSPYSGYLCYGKINITCKHETRS